MTYPLFLLSHIIYTSAFQQAVVRNMNDKNAQLQKQLENVVREGAASIITDVLSCSTCISTS